ncbi:MAG: oligosaccharide flippase family protein [Oscillospiraceae bacterium]|nr:oligosaccharide flippase family protein [Oscillospiraceae bacterium]
MSKSIAVNSVYNFLLKVFRLIVPILVGPYIQRLFDKELYGIFNDATTWLDFALIFGIFGIYTYGVREAAAVRDDKEKCRRLYTSLFVIGLITNTVVLCAYTGVVFFAMDTMSRVIYLVLGAKVFANIFMVEWLNEAIENYRFITVKTVIVRLIYVIGIFALIHEPDDVVKYSVLIVATDILNNLISFVYVTRKVPFTFRGLELKKHVPSLVSILLISNVNLLYTQLDRMMLGQVDKVAITVYKTPMDVTYMIGQLLASIVLVAVPRLAYYSAGDEKGRFMDLLNKSYRSFMLVVFPACTGIACLAPEIMWIYGGGKYDESIPVLIIFAVRTMESAVYTICANQVLYVLHQEKFLVRALLVFGLVNAALNGIFFALGLFTPVAAVSTTFAAEVLLMCVIFRHIRAKLDIDLHFFNKENVRYLALSALFIPVTLGVRALGFGDIVTSLIAVPSCMGIYFGALLVMKDETMLFLSGKVLGKVPGLNKLLKR